MAYGARVIADSISEAGARLTTLEVTLPRIVLAEFNTHRVFSRNSASSRAIPVAKQIERIRTDPFIPFYWGANQSGMQAARELTGYERDQAESEWLSARDNAIAHVEQLLALGLHKQISNRLLEPFMWQTILVTATEWSNFYALRINAQAQPEIRRAAELMHEAQAASTPQLVAQGEWHLPLIQPDEEDWARKHPEVAVKISAGRCARVSYLTHDGVRDHDKDIELCERLASSGHMSPLEHVATPIVQEPSTDLCFFGNFRGWMQFRKTIEGEDDFSKLSH